MTGKVRESFAAASSEAEEGRAGGVVTTLRGIQMFKEFRDFAVKGNMIDLAVGVIIGAAFGAIVSSIVDDIFMPLIGLILGRVDFSNLFIVLNNPGNVAVPSVAAAKAAGVATLNIGLFLNALVKFLIVAWVLFMMIKVINMLKRQAKIGRASCRERV